MNAKLLLLCLVAAFGLIIVPQTSEAAICTFDVDASPGIGTGSFVIDLPDDWPTSGVQVTVIPASSVRGFYARGDKWTALSVSLTTILEQGNSAELFGVSKKAGSFKGPTKGFGFTPVTAVASLPGFALRDRVVTQSEVNRQRRSQLLARNILLKASSSRSR